MNETRAFFLLKYINKKQNTKVISQEPAAGSNLGAGASVDIVIRN